MSETNNKRPRKSKLVPRNFDSENDSSTNLQSPAKKPKPLQEVSASIKFDVKVEVEEFCEDFEDNGIVAGDEAKSNTFFIKSEVDHDMEESDINENRTLDAEIQNNEVIDDLVPSTSALDKNKDKTNKKSLLNDIYNSSRISAESVKQCKISDETVFSELDKLSSTELSKADKILIIESRNSWGRIATVPHRYTNIDFQIQNLLNHWKRSYPLIYKCYICKLGWWHLYEFREHLMSNHDRPEINCFLEKFYNECLMVACYNSKPAPSFDITVNSDCWRCGKNLELHSRCQVVGSYICQYCNINMNTCLAFERHKGNCTEYRKYLNENRQDGQQVEFHQCFICKLFLLTKDLLNKHFINYHSVRSDLMVTTFIRTCKPCGMNYAQKKLHTCPRQSYSILCGFCLKRFPSQVMLHIHRKVSKESYKCKICDEMIDSMCKEANHMVSHSENFMVVYKCVTCDENIFLLDEVSMKQHLVIWHKKKFDRRRNFVEPVVVPVNCVTSGTVALDIVTSLSGKFGITAKPNSAGILEVSEVEEFNFRNKKPKNFIKTNENTASENCTADNEEIEFKITIDDNFRVIDNESDVHTSVNEEVDAPNTSDTDEEDDGQIEAELMSVFKIKKEKDDDIKESVQEVDDIFNQVIKQEPNLESNENDDYATLLAKVFSGTHNLGAASTHNFGKIEFKIKEEPIDEELFEDDIITLNKGECSKVSKKTPRSPSKPRPSTSKMKIIVYEDGRSSPRKRLTPHPSQSEMKPCKTKGLKCNRCDAKGIRFESWKHLSNCHDEYKCTKCHIDYSTLEEYGWHFTLHGYPKKTCPECDMFFENKTNFAMHIKMHVAYSFCKEHSLENRVGADKDIEGSIDILYRCKKCREIVDVALLFAHWEKHLDLAKTKDSNNEFDDSELNTTFALGLLKEIKEALLSPRRGADNRLCCVCDHSFDRCNDHKRHLIEHLLNDALSRFDVDKSLVCHFCGNASEKPDHFRHHLREHANLPVYKCVICTKTFSDPSNFAKHRKTHNFHLHRCNVCQKKFHSSANLKLHMKIHKTTTPIACVQCNKLFYEDSLYRKHMRVRHTEIQFSCSLCKSKYPSIKQKWDHMWDVHKLRKHNNADCPLCHMSFRKFQDVREHMRTQHSTKVTFVKKKLIDVVKMKKEDDNILGMSQVGNTMFYAVYYGDTKNENKVTKSKNKNTKSENKDTISENKDTKNEK